MKALKGNLIPSIFVLILFGVLTMSPALTPNADENLAAGLAQVLLFFGTIIA